VALLSRGPYPARPWRKPRSARNADHHGRRRGWPNQPRVRRDLGHHALRRSAFGHRYRAAANRRPRNLERQARRKRLPLRHRVPHAGGPSQRRRPCRDERPRRFSARFAGRTDQQAGEELGGAHPGNRNHARRGLRAPVRSLGGGRPGAAARSRRRRQETSRARTRAGGVSLMRSLATLAVGLLLLLLQSTVMEFSPVHLVTPSLGLLVVLYVGMAPLKWSA